MAGIKDLLSLFHWMDNQQDYLLEASMMNFPPKKEPTAKAAPSVPADYPSNSPAKTKARKKS